MTFRAPCAFSYTNLERREVEALLQWAATEAVESSQLLIAFCQMSCGLHILLEWHWVARYTNVLLRDLFGFMK